MAELTGFISLGVLIIVQIVVAAVGYGRLQGKVDAVDRRLNDLSHRFDKIEERVHELEIRR
jgi:hypothetical protein